MDLLGGAESLSSAVSLAAFAAASGHQVGLVDGARMDTLLSAHLQQNAQHFFSDWADDKGQTFAANSNQMPVGSRGGILHWLGPPTPPLVDDRIEAAAFAHLAAAARDQLDALFFLVGPSWRAGAIPASHAADRVFILTRRDTHGTRLVLDIHSWAPDTLKWLRGGAETPTVLALPGNADAGPLRYHEMAALLTDAGCMWSVRSVPAVTSKDIRQKFLLAGKARKALGGILAVAAETPSLPGERVGDGSGRSWASFFRWLPWLRREGEPIGGETDPHESIGWKTPDVPPLIHGPSGDPPSGPMNHVPLLIPEPNPHAAPEEEDAPQIPDWSMFLPNWPPADTPAQGTEEDYPPGLVYPEMGDFGDDRMPAPAAQTAGEGVKGALPDARLQQRRLPHPTDSMPAFGINPRPLQSKKSPFPDLSSPNSSTNHDNPWAHLLRLVDRPPGPNATNENGKG